MNDITEADEAATDKVTALSNLQYQIVKGETMGIIGMYEQAAINAGASGAEISQVEKIASLLKRKV